MAKGAIRIEDPATTLAGHFVFAEVFQQAGATRLASDSIAYHSKTERGAVVSCADDMLAARGVAAGMPAQGGWYMDGAGSRLQDGGTSRAVCPTLRKGGWHTWLQYRWMRQPGPPVWALWVL